MTATGNMVGMLAEAHKLEELGRTYILAYPDETTRNELVRLFEKLTADSEMENADDVKTNRYEVEEMCGIYTLMYPRQTTRTELLCLLGRLAADPKSPLRWFDAAIISNEMRAQTFQQVEEQGEFSPAEQRSLDLWESDVD